MPFVMKQQIGNRLKLIGMAVSAAARFCDSAKDIFRKIPSEVTRDKQIKQAIPVVVNKHRTRRPPRASHSGCFRRVTEGTVAVVAIKSVMSDVSDIYVGITVIVIISHGDSHSITVTL